VHPHGLLQLQPEQSLHDAHAQDPVSEIKIENLHLEKESERK